IDFYSLIFYFTEFNSLKFDVEYPVTLNHKEDYYIYTKPTIDKCKNSKVNYSIGSFIGFPEAYLFFEGPRVEQVKKTCFEILEDIDVEKFRKKIGTKGKPITKFLNEQKTIKANGNQKYSKKVSEINSKHMFTAGIRYFK